MSVRNFTKCDLGNLILERLTIFDLSNVLEHFFQAGGV